MSTTVLSPTIITRKALIAFVNNLTFAKGVNRQYDSQFANTGASPSGKIGPTLTIRKPNRFTITSGAALAVQDIAEESTTFTVSQRFHVGFTFPTIDLTLTIDDFMERYVNRAIEPLANKVDYDGLTLAYQTVANSVGTADGNPPASPKPYLYANAKLDELATPQSGRRYAIINPIAQAATVNGLTTLFNPSGTISRQYEKGAMGDALGLTFKMDQNVNSHICGTRAAASESTVTTTSTSGDTTIALTTGSGVTFKKGDVFTVADVYAVNPQNRTSTGSLRQFVVTADYTATGTSAAALPIWPAPVLTGAKQNVNKLPTSGDAVTFVGTASTTYPQNIVCWEDAFSLVTCDLEMPQGVHFAGRENYEGISLRIVRQYSIDSDQIPCRIDILYGWKELYPDAACRIWGPLS